MNNKAMQKLKIAASNGHNEAKYVYCILLMNSTDKKRRDRGFDMFCSLKGTTELSICRNRVKSFIQCMWMRKERIPIQEFSWCHSKKHAIERHSYAPSAIIIGNKHGSWNRYARYDADAEIREFSTMTNGSA
ncbi:uncharacterized protein LOC133300044 [Gastrolobium bilobum]|uniref:uncharacterized protein LOC133300044 n=1 Tax=Gastrolobium bilobum TaxID=150636 RepID=UPI002AB0EB54|nr:uncharacterized protein LOC133300044 [Gastrolobium bilobum]